MINTIFNSRFVVCVSSHVNQIDLKHSPAKRKTYISPRDLWRAAFERRAAVAAHRADDLVNLALPATSDAHRKQTAFFTHHSRSLQWGLSDFARKHFSVRARTIQVEPSPAYSGLRRHVLPTIEKIRLRCTASERRQRDQSDD